MRSLIVFELSACILVIAALEEAAKAISGHMEAVVAQLVTKYKEDEKKLQRLDKLQQHDAGQYV